MSFNYSEKLKGACVNRKGHITPDRTIHTGLCVKNVDLIKQFPHEFKQHMINFEIGIVTLLHTEVWKGGITPKDVELIYKSICSRTKHENLYARGYWQKDSVTILSVEFRGRNVELFVVDHNDNKPINMKRRISEGYYGKKVEFDTNISLPYVPYIYKNNSKYTYFEI